MLLLCQYDGVSLSLLFVSAMGASATDVNISVGDDDALHLSEGVLLHLCHGSPFG